MFVLVSVVVDQLVLVNITANSLCRIQHQTCVQPLWRLPNTQQIQQVLDDTFLGGQNIF